MINKFQREQEANEKEILQFLEEGRQHQDRIGELFAQDFSEKKKELAEMMRKEGIDISSDKEMSEDDKILENLENQISEKDLNQYQFNRLSDVSRLLESHSSIADAYADPNNPDVSANVKCTTHLHQKCTSKNGH